MGQALKIKLGKHEVAPGKVSLLAICRLTLQSILITITYSTTTDCTALGWLNKE